MKEDIVAELSKYSIETLIKVFIDNNIFDKGSLLGELRYAEFNSIQLKQKKLAADMKKLHPWNDHIKYVELRNKYARYEKQIDKLLKLM